MNLDELLKTHPERELDIAINLLKGRSWWEWTDQETGQLHTVLQERLRLGAELSPEKVDKPSKNSNILISGFLWTQHIELAWSLVQEMEKDDWAMCFYTPQKSEEIWNNYSAVILNHPHVPCLKGETMQIAICKMYLYWREKNERPIER